MKKLFVFFSSSCKVWFLDLRRFSFTATYSLYSDVCFFYSQHSHFFYFLVTDSNSWPYMYILRVSMMDISEYTNYCSAFIVEHNICIHCIGKYFLRLSNMTKILLQLYRFSFWDFCANRFINVELHFAI